MTGRTTIKHTRFYADGYDLSGYTRSYGPLTWAYDTAEEAALTDAVKGALPSTAQLGVGALNGFFDNTAASGLHVVTNSAVSNMRTVMIPFGMRAAPALGDPVYVGQFPQLSYAAETDANWLYANLGFGMVSTLAGVNGKYTKPWGVLLHDKAAKTVPGTAIGFDDNGASSSFGGYMVYQVFAMSGSGTVVVKVQDADTNLHASFADLSGALKIVADTEVPTAGVVAIGTTATVRRYIRYQIAFTGVTSITFALAFVRSLAQGV